MESTRSDVRMFEPSPAFLNFSIERILAPDFGPNNKFPGKWQTTRAARRSFGESDFCTLLRNIEGNCDDAASRGGPSPFTSCSSGEDSDDIGGGHGSSNRLLSSPGNDDVKLFGGMVFSDNSNNNFRSSSPLNSDGESPPFCRRTQTEFQRSFDRIHGVSTDGFSPFYRRTAKGLEAEVVNREEDLVKQIHGNSMDETEGFDLTSKYGYDSRESKTRLRSLKLSFVDNTAISNTAIDNAVVNHGPTAGSEKNCKQIHGDSTEGFDLTSRHDLENKPVENPGIDGNNTRSYLRTDHVRYSLEEVVPFQNGPNSKSSPESPKSSSSDFKNSSNSPKVVESQPNPSDLQNRHNGSNPHTGKQPNPKRSLDDCMRNSLDSDLLQNRQNPPTVVRSEPKQLKLTRRFSSDSDGTSVDDSRSKDSCVDAFKRVPGGEDAKGKTREAVPEKEWPVWVYCSRYSARPSSGPRSRRQSKPPRTATTPNSPSSLSSADEKRCRTAFSPPQLQRLRAEFATSAYLGEPRRRALSKELGLSEAQLKIWFQNRRAKVKKASGERNPLALRLMKEGLYNHSTSAT